MLRLPIDGEFELLLTIRKQLEENDIVLNDTGKWAWEGGNCHQLRNSEGRAAHTLLICLFGLGAAGACLRTFEISIIISLS